MMPPGHTSQLGRGERAAYAEPLDHPGEQGHWSHNKGERAAALSGRPCLGGGVPLLGDNALRCLSILDGGSGGSLTKGSMSRYRLAVLTSEGGSPRRKESAPLRHLAVLVSKGCNPLVGENVPHCLTVLASGRGVASTKGSMPRRRLAILIRHRLAA